MITHDIEYPTELQDIVVIGFKSPTRRSFLVRPRGKGYYDFLVWPSDAPSGRYALRTLLYFPEEHSAPENIDLDFRKNGVTRFRDWQWALLPIQGPHRRPLLSSVVAETIPGERGAFSILDPSLDETSRTLVWSCHQPFETIGNRCVVAPHTAGILKWYAEVATAFNPDIIWGGGDSAYSDGTAAANFVDQLYNVPGWYRDEGVRRWLINSYRRMYQHHWSFEDFSQVLRNHAHVFMWDDHEIRDGWGSEAGDFTENNYEMYKLAKSIAEEFILNMGPRIRHSGDAHLAYVLGAQANFLFDTRTSRNYAAIDSRVVSEVQLNDFEAFCAEVAGNYKIKYLLTCTTVPIVHTKIGIVHVISDTPKWLTDVMEGIRDDVRDGWMSPRNIGQLRRLLSIIRRLMRARPDLAVLNISGDVHVGNAFEIHLRDVPRPVLQVTTSAITNRQHVPEWLAELIGIDEAEIEGIGYVKRIWPDIDDPNVLEIESSSSRAYFRLRSFDNEHGKTITRELEV